MNKTSITALQFFSNFFQKVDNISDIFSELAADQRFPEDLRSHFASASHDIEFCYMVIGEAIDFVCNNEFPENGNENPDKTDGKPRN